MQRCRRDCYRHLHTARNPPTASVSAGTATSGRNSQVSRYKLWMRPRYMSHRAIVHTCQPHRRSRTGQDRVQGSETCKRRGSSPKIGTPRNYPAVAPGVGFPFSNIPHLHDYSPSRNGGLHALSACASIGTGIRAPPNLDGEIHPVFRNWVGSEGEDEESRSLRDELHQPLLLASRLLESAGLTWLSEFCIDDIFGSAYPGQKVNLNAADAKRPEDSVARHVKPHQERYDEDTTPKAIARHHRAPWVTPQLAKMWLDATAYELRTVIPECVQWKLDVEIFPARGWVGYTCRYSRGPQKRGISGLETAALDYPEAIRVSDERARAKGARSRFLTVLVMEGYASRMRVLRRLGLVGGEEYLCTAFMAAVTMLHE